MFKDEIQSLTDLDLFKSSIVVADDEPVNRLLIGKYLSTAGFTNVHMAVNGAEAMELVEQVNAELLILDIVMPVMNGFAVLTALRESEKWAALPILVETALDAPEERSKVFDMGATDLVTKPLNGKELISRVKIHLERGLLIGKLREFHERISEDLSRAQSMQRNLLPTARQISEIESQYRIRISSAFHPCTELGGDLWTVQSIDEHSFALLMADLSGHGITAALNSFRLHTSLREMDLTGADAADVLGYLNRRLATVFPLGQFAAAFCCVVNVQTRAASYACAAWPNPILIGSDGVKAFLDGSGLPLGIDEAMTYEVKKFEFSQDMTVLGFSDALIESTDETGTMIGETSLHDMVATACRDGGELLPNLMAAFRARAGEEVDDDLTVVTLSG